LTAPPVGAPDVERTDDASEHRALHERAAAATPSITLKSDGSFAPPIDPPRPRPRTTLPNHARPRRLIAKIFPREWTRTWRPVFLFKAISGRDRLSADFW
jgi:hypothetical protein